MPNMKEFYKLTEIESIDLDSFKLRDELAPNVWTDNNKLQPEIRKRLLEISNDFYESLEVGKADLEDVILTGSLANYNWSEYSDVDLHLMVAYKDVDENEALVADYFKAKKGIWNDAHDITVLGYDVEVYVQDTEEDHVATGVYSVLFDKWLVEPKKDTKPSIDEKSITLKSEDIMNRIDAIETLYDRGRYADSIKKIKIMKEKIRKFRKCGLTTGGEFSVENLAFKALRRNGYLEKLGQIQMDAYDKMMTIK